MISVWYHGTNESSAINICEIGIDFSKSKKELDFGEGFYLSDDKAVAIRRALQKTKIFNRIHKCKELPAIVKVSLDMSLLFENKVKYFEYCNDDWLYFVIANRLSDEYLNANKKLEHNRDLRYDVVIGSIADSNVSQIASHIDKGNIDIKDVSVYDLLTNDGRTLGTQMSLHTLSSLKYIIKKEYEIIDERRI